MATLSIGTMIEQLSALTTTDLTDWEEDFVKSIVEKYSNGKEANNFAIATVSFSAKQVTIIERIWQLHFSTQQE
jgi:hypothetical protein